MLVSLHSSFLNFGKWLNWNLLCGNIHHMRRKLKCWLDIENHIQLWNKMCCNLLYHFQVSVVDSLLLYKKWKYMKTIIVSCRYIWSMHLEFRLIHQNWKFINLHSELGYMNICQMIREMIGKNCIIISARTVWKIIDSSVPSNLEKSGVAHKIVILIYRLYWN